MTVPPRPTTPPSAWKNGTPGPRQGGQQRVNMSKPNKDAARTNAFLAGISTDPRDRVAAGVGHDNHDHGHDHAGHGGPKSSVPGADFMSNEDIRAYCEHRRKNARNQATELAMDADQFEAVLKTIPDTTGNHSGSRARARRVSRWLKKAAAAEKAQQKYFAALYATFEREYEAELRKIGKGRAQQNVRQKFGWR